MTGGIAPRQTVRRFLDPELAEIARAAEERYRERFRAYRADFKVEPTRISHLRSVGEGLELALHPTIQRAGTGGATSNPASKYAGGRASRDRGDG